MTTTSCPLSELLTKHGVIIIIIIIYNQKTSENVQRWSPTTMQNFQRKNIKKKSFRIKSKIVFMLTLEI